MYCGLGSIALPVKLWALIVPAGVTVWLCVPSAEPVNVSAGTVPAPPLNVGTPAGQLKEAVGTPAGQAIVPTGVKLTVEFVPAGVSVCVCVAKADPVKVGALTVPAGVPALTDWLRATAALVVLAVPVALTAVAARLVPVPKVATAIWRVVVVVGIWNGNSWACPDSALPVNVGAEFVPAGVPALVAEVTWFDVPVKVSAGTVPAVPEKVGTPTGQESAAVGTPAGHAIVPDGVKLAVEFVPAGVPADTALVA